MNHERFRTAPTFPEYLSTVEKHPELWQGVYDRVRLSEDQLEAGRAVPGRWHLVALSEDWCGDAANTLPVVARYAEEMGWTLRVFSRDENDDLMDAHLTDGRSRSIPVVIVYDEDFNEVGWWGPRPSELQAWVLEEGLSMSSPERYKVVRRWYAQDRGQSVVRELLAVMPAAV